MRLIRTSRLPGRKRVAGVTEESQIQWWAQRGGVGADHLQQGGAAAGARPDAVGSLLIGLRPSRPATSTAQLLTAALPDLRPGMPALPALDPLTRSPTHPVTSIRPTFSSHTSGTKVGVARWCPVVV